MHIQIPLYFITLARCLNNEHKDNQEIHPKFDFERTSCTDKIDFEKDMIKLISKRIWMMKLYLLK